MSKNEIKTVVQCCREDTCTKHGLKDFLGK